jgi:hypothetical protein
VLTLAGGLLVRLTDPEAITSIGTGLWWALQTVTTVGYGDIVPNSTAGRLTAAVVMLAGLSLLAVTTAAVTNAFVQAAARRRGRERDDRVLAELTALRAELAELAAASPPPRRPIPLQSAVHLARARTLDLTPATRRPPPPRPWARRDPAPHRRQSATAHGLRVRKRLTGPHGPPDALAARIHGGCCTKAGVGPGCL